MSRFIAARSVMERVVPMAPDITTPRHLLDEVDLIVATE
jgi:hypothetical protein